MAFPVLNLLTGVFKVGTHLYQNRQKTKMLMSDAQMRHAEKMAHGQVEKKQKLLRVTTKVGKMNLSWCLSVFLFLYWAILSSLTILTFVLN